MRVSKQRLVVGFFVATGLPAACDGGEAARPGRLDATRASDNASDGSRSESGTSFDSGGTCNSCSVDTDCTNGCPNPPRSGYIWCCGLGTCFTWPNECPPLAVDAGSGPPDSGSDALPDDGGLLNASPDCQPSGAHGGHRWQDLYNCYFGPTGNVSCGSVTGCHHLSGDPSAIASHFVCNPTSDACWQSLTTSSALSSAPSDPTMALFYIVLCKSNGSGVMPQGCPLRLLTGDLARITAWMQEGAPNN
jgi:hypothetical protein